MLLLYSLFYSLAFLLMLPLFILRREKYASGFRERLGNYPAFENDGRPVIWLHCVSVGETNAARPLVNALKDQFPDHRLIVSTTTKTGQDLARRTFKEKADAVVYFPFDWKFSVRRALENFRPSLVLLMETEIWPRFIGEAKRSGAAVAIVNGRLSQRSTARYSMVRSFVKEVLHDVDLALMQNETDADRLRKLGMPSKRVKVTGNLKFQTSVTAVEEELTKQLRVRFGFDSGLPLIVAASTHDPEERWILEALDGELGHSCRLVIAPRHPERFDAVAGLLSKSHYRFIRRSSAETELDKTAPVILLDTIGELRAVYPLAQIVFVGGSLVHHGGQSVIEPATVGRAVVTGPYTFNFDGVVKEFLAADALLQTPEVPKDFQNAERLYEMFTLLLENDQRRNELARNAEMVVRRNSADAARLTVSALKEVISQ